MLWMYSIYLEGELITQDYNYDSEREAESEAGFCINSLLDSSGYEDRGYSFYDFKIVTEVQ